MRIGSHCLMLTPLRLSLPSLRETVSAQLTLPFREKVCHLRGTKQRKPAQWSTCHMDYDELVAKVIELLQREKRVPYRVLKRRFELDDDYIEDLKIDLIEAKQLAVDENDRILVWIGDAQEVADPSAQPTPKPDVQAQPATQVEPLSTASPPDAERRQLTVMFCD